MSTIVKMKNPANSIFIESQRESNEMRRKHKIEMQSINAAFENRKIRMDAIQDELSIAMRENNKAEIISCLNRLNALIDEPVNF